MWNGEWKLLQKVLFVYNWVPDEERTEAFRECASTKTIQSIELALKSFNLEVVHLNLKNQEQIGEVLEQYSPITIAFVIAEGFLDEPETLYDGSGALRVRQALEYYNLPYTHSNVETMEFCRNKDLTYERLGHREGIVIPRFFVFSPSEDLSTCVERAEYVVGYPMFIKPCGGGCSIGIDEQSIVHNRTELLAKIAQLNALIGEQPILAETYLCGREYTVGVLGNGVPHVLPVIAFPEYFSIRSQEVKATEYRDREHFEILSSGDLLGVKIKEIALSVFQAMGAQDLIRIDLRDDGQGKVYVIDVNGTPSLSITSSLSYTLENCQVNYEQFVGYFLYVAMTRSNIMANDSLTENAINVSNKLQGIFENQIA